MAEITFTIPDAKLQRVKDGILRVFPNNETKPDPSWVDSGDGSAPDMIPRYTDNQWLKERTRRFIIDTVRRGESKVAQDAAAAALTETDSLVG